MDASTPPDSGGRGDASLDAPYDFDAASDSPSQDGAPPPPADAHPDTGDAHRD
jgi:hypothetical protein